MRSLDEYYQRIDAGRLAVFRGVTLTQDDLIRRDVITRLICHYTLNIADVEACWKIDFNDYFADELARLQAMEADGLISIEAGAINVLPRGRLLIRNICMQFDIYLDSKASQGSFSKVI
jgi:oxygen-independent coproporphyrinogen-3 oxidase